MRFSSRYAIILVLLGLTVLMSACIGPPTPEPNRTLQEEINHYLFDRQNTNGEDFVTWAEEKLGSKYSSRHIYRSIEAEARLEAAQGHPNAVAALSNFAQAWATRYALTYEHARWVNIQAEAIDNMRENPDRPIRLWPE